jgi:hypothetical protein
MRIKNYVCSHKILSIHMSSPDNVVNKDKPILFYKNKYYIELVKPSPTDTTSVRFINKRNLVIDVGRDGCKVIIQNTLFHCWEDGTWRIRGANRLEWDTKKEYWFHIADNSIQVSLTKVGNPIRKLPLSVDQITWWRLYVQAP